MPLAAVTGERLQSAPTGLAPGPMPWVASCVVSAVLVAGGVASWAMAGQAISALAASTVEIGRTTPLLRKGCGRRLGHGWGLQKVAMQQQAGQPWPAPSHAQHFALKFRVPWPMLL